MRALRALNEADPGDPLERTTACLATLDQLAAGTRPNRREGGNADAHAFSELEPLVTGKREPLVVQAVGEFLSPLLERMVETLLDFPGHRLAVYGSLAPGEANHDILDGIEGDWVDGSVRGERFEEGWGAGLGYPGFRWDPEAESIPVQVFSSPELPEHWERIDRFEGPSYRRILVPVQTVAVVIVCNLYAAVEGQSTEVDNRPAAPPA